MLRNKMVGLFSSHQKLINEAKVLYALLETQSTVERDVPRQLLQLGAKYKAILKHDSEALQKRIPDMKNNELLRDQAQQVLTAINALLSHQHLEQENVTAFEYGDLPEAKNFNNVVKFIADRAAYAEQVKLHLLELKDDIASTHWKRAKLEYVSQKGFWVGDDSSAEEDDSEECIVKWEYEMPSPVASMSAALDDDEMKRVKTAVDVLVKYQEVMRHLDRLGAEKNLHPEASSFYRYHQDQINSLQFVAVKAGVAGNRKLG